MLKLTKFLNGNFYDIETTNIIPYNLEELPPENDYKLLISIIKNGNITKYYPFEDSSHSKSFFVGTKDDIITRYNKKIKITCNTKLLKNDIKYLFIEKKISKDEVLVRKLCRASTFALYCNNKIISMNSNIDYLTDDQYIDVTKAFLMTVKFTYNFSNGDSLKFMLNTLSKIISPTKVYCYYDNVKVLTINFSVEEDPNNYVTWVIQNNKTDTQKSILGPELKKFKLWTMKFDGSDNLAVKPKFLVYNDEKINNFNDVKIINNAFYIYLLQYHQLIKEYLECNKSNKFSNKFNSTTEFIKNLNLNIDYLNPNEIKAINFIRKNLNKIF